MKGYCLCLHFVTDADIIRVFVITVVMMMLHLTLVLPSIVYHRTDIGALNLPLTPYVAYFCTMPITTLNVFFIQKPVSIGIENITAIALILLSDIFLINSADSCKSILYKVSYPW